MKLKTLVCLSLIALVAMLSPAAHAQTFSVIYSFTPPSGLTPFGGVTLRAGVLYGTTECTQGDSCGNGTVYQLTHVGSNWYHALLSLFSAGGSNPEARVLFGPDNHLYGTALAGGSQGDGIVFNLTPQQSICRSANCFWTEKVLYSFQGSPDGEDLCCGDLAWDSAGDIYGTTYRGGNSSCNPPGGCGTVFEMTKSGDNWTEMPIYGFTGPDGEFPSGGVVLDGSGNLFGITTNGGLYSSGTVFELTYTNGVGWTETVLHNFQYLSDGQPAAGLLRDSTGNLYGTTGAGGSGLGGTVFELSPVGDAWVFTTLYSFSGDNDCGPAAALTMDNSGNLYGTTLCNGSDGWGSVFELTNTQNGWEYTSLHDFTGFSDGRFPISVVTIDTDGTLYGTASKGGSSSCNPQYECGTVWMIKP